MALVLLVLAMYISCIFHVVCASFSALATRKFADAEANSSGIWALNLCDIPNKINNAKTEFHPSTSIECRG